MLVLCNLYISIKERSHYCYLPKITLAALHWAKSFLPTVFEKFEKTLILAKSSQDNPIGEGRVGERETCSSYHFWELNMKNVSMICVWPL